MIKKPLTRTVLKALSMTALVFMGKAAVAGIHKSPNDHRDHLSFKLSNDLSVLLISDPNADKAAAAMNIAVGSNADPETRPGLAHFLEHMLFLGTEKYPDASAYQKFIQANGGHTNAYTAHENTNYFFDVSADNLKPALDRFAQFFISPLLDEKYVDRERHAVHSEYRAKIRDDARRTYSATKQVMNPSHTYSNFTVGSLKTLAGDVRPDLVKFYDQYYSANMMTLVVEGKESLAELKAMVEQMFSAVPNKQTKPISVKAPLFETGTLPARLSIKTLKDTNSITLTFPVDSVRDHWHEKPLHYISDLVGYEGHGSLLAYLKEQGLADGLSSSTGIDLKEQAAFKVKIDLTEHGVSHQSQVIESFFAYIEMMKEDGIKASLYEEQRRVKDTHFRFSKASNAMQEVSRLAAMMQRYPTEHVFDAPYVMDSFNADQIQEYLAQISPNNMLITEQSPDVETNQVDPWYKTGYRVDKLTDQELSRWQQPAEIAELSVRSNNPFIAQDLELKPLSDHDAHDTPEVVFQRDGMRLWHLQDQEFKAPKAETYLSVVSPHANNTVSSAIMTSLFTMLVKDQLNETLYDAQLAGLSTRMYGHMRGFSVRISGYNDKQDLLLEQITRTVKTAKFDEKRFDLIKAQFREKLANADKDKPFNQTIREIFRLLLPQWSTEEKLAALDSVTLPQLEAFIPNLFQENSIRMMTHGNLTTEEAIGLARIVEDAFVPEQLVTAEAEAPVVQLTDNAPLVQTLDIQHNDSAISVYFQGQDTDVQSHAEFSLLSEIVASPFYTQLRTEKQLGYIVFGTPLKLGKAPGLAFVVQSPNTEPQVLESHISDFVTNLGATLDAMDAQQLERFKQSLIAKVMKKDKNMIARSNRFWHNIDEEALDFDSHETLANAVADLSLADLKDCYEKMAARQLVVRSYGQKHKEQNGNQAETKKRCDKEIQRMKARGEYFEA
mgnify:CR=1 FL=1